MNRTQTKEAAKIALKRFVQEGRTEVDTRDYSSVVYKDDMTIIVTFAAPTKRNPDRLTQHIYSMECKFSHATTF